MCRGARRARKLKRGRVAVVDFTSEFALGLFEAQAALAAGDHVTLQQPRWQIRDE